jgi:hypothetical protein
MFQALVATYACLSNPTGVACLLVMVEGRGGDHPLLSGRHIEAECCPRSAQVNDTA